MTIPLSVSALVVLVLLLAVCGCNVRYIRKEVEKERRKKSEKRRDDLRQEQVELQLKLEEAKLARSGKIDDHNYRYKPFPGMKTTDEWEIDRRLVTIDYNTKLGQGAFGSVYLGLIQSKNIPHPAAKSIIEMSSLVKDNDAVALKMLHESADRAAQLQFLEEIDLMKRIGYHERLVNMLACITESEPSMLILEYCAHGDLLNYMRGKREFMLDSSSIDVSLDRSKIITQKEQLMFCVQIAYGMEYLSQRGFIHRDIAARNILVDKNDTCKIGDFGLCREVEKEDQHYHSRGGRLPLKWMAPEAVEKYDFSIESDVWSFGVLLFEIITLGGTPYPDWPAAEILSRLKRGRRMDRPDNCSDHVFALMQSCWELNPGDRPDFFDLRMKLGVALEEVSTDDYYLKLNSRALYYTVQSDIGENVSIEDENSNDEHTLKL